MLLKRFGVLWMIGVVSIWAAGVPASVYSQPSCLPTPPQTEGPFYPVEDQADKDADLTMLRGHPQKAAGSVLYIHGRLRDSQCRPVSDATVEIWQAAASGRYKHPDDRNSKAQHDPHFQHWGMVRTDKDGRFMFKTVMPSPYPASVFWTRPAHIHYKVHRPGFPALTTQMYFEGDPYLKTDFIYQDIPSAERSRVVVKTRKADDGAEREALAADFDIGLP